MHHDDGGLARGLPAVAHLDAEAHRPGLPVRLLTNRDQQRDPIGHERPRVGRAVPGVDGVVRPAPQRPDGRAQAERRADLDAQACDPHRYLPLPAASTSVSTAAAECSTSRVAVKSTRRPWPRASSRSRETIAARGSQSSSAL